MCCYLCLVHPSSFARTPAQEDQPLFPSLPWLLFVPAPTLTSLCICPPHSHAPWEYEFGLVQLCILWGNQGTCGQGYAASESDVWALPSRHNSLGTAESSVPRRKCMGSMYRQSLHQVEGLVGSKGESVGGKDSESRSWGRFSRRPNSMVQSSGQEAREPWCCSHEWEVTTGEQSEQREQLYLFLSTQVLTSIQVPESFHISQWELLWHKEGLQIAFSATSVFGTQVWTQTKVIFFSCFTSCEWKLWWNKSWFFFPLWEQIFVRKGEGKRKEERKWEFERPTHSLTLDILGCWAGRAAQCHY